jgi:hypothetical protein
MVQLTDRWRLRDGIARTHPPLVCSDLRPSDLTASMSSPASATRRNGIAKLPTLGDEQKIWRKIERKLRFSCKKSN